MREMRLGKREVKSREELLGIVEACKVLRLGLMDEEGMFVVPVSFGYEAAEGRGEKPVLRLFFHSAAQGRKADALRKNPGVAIEMDCGYELITGDYSCSYSCAYKSLMGTGKARLLTDKEEKIHGLARIMEHLVTRERTETVEEGTAASSGDFAFKDEALERTNVYCIETEHYTGKMRAKKTEK